MTLAFDSLQKKTIHEVLEWHRFQVEVLGREKTRVLADLRTSAATVDPRFIGMTRDDVDDFFGLHRNELDFVTMLDLMSAAEAAIQIDYRDRVSNRYRDAVSRCFRNINKRLSGTTKAGRPDLENDLLDVWTANCPKTKAPAREFKGALKLRHWLAHGRYWNPRLGRQQYTSGDVFDICNDLLRAIGALST